MDDLEAKTRHVRDAAFWGAPVGTPLPLPKKPEVERRSPRVPAAWTRGEFTIRKPGDEVVDDDHATLVKQIVDAGHCVYQDDAGDIVAIDASLVRNGYAPAAEVEGLLSDVKTMISLLPAKARKDKNGKPVKVAVIVPDGDPQLPLVTSNRQVLSGVTLGYTVMGTGVINLNPTLLIPAEDQPFALEMATVASSGPYAESQPLRLGTLVHESGHFMDGVLGSIPPVEVVSPTTGEPELVIRRKDGDFYRQMLRNFPRVDGSYASSSPQEAYAEAYAEWTLGDRRDAVWAGFADAYAFYYGWETDDVDSPKGLRLGGRKRLAVAGDGPQFAGGPAGIGAPEGSQGLKTRHVRDSTFWGAPVGTPLPLPKKPESPMDVLHRYQARDMKGGIDILKHQIENTEKTVESIRNGFSKEFHQNRAATVRAVREDGLNLPLAELDEIMGNSSLDAYILAKTGTDVEKMLNRNKERQQTIDRYNDAIAGKGPYPLVTDEQMDDYISDATLKTRHEHWVWWHKRTGVEWDERTLPPSYIDNYRDSENAWVKNDPEIAALREAKKLVQQERVSRYGIELSNPEALLQDDYRYSEMISDSLPTRAHDEFVEAGGVGTDGAASIVKAQVQKDIYNRMFADDKDNSPRRQFVKEIMEWPDGDYAYSDDLIENSAMKAVRVAVDNWANSSGNDHPECVAMQLIALLEFGLNPDRTYVPEPNPAYSSPDAVQTNMGRGTKGRRVFLRAMYDLTQEWLKEQGIEAVVCMRGFGHAHWDSSMEEDQIHEVEQQPMSSWAVADRDTAREFGSNILMSIIPREKILSTPRTGFGCLRENEIVTIADTLPGEVIP